MKKSLILFLILISSVCYARPFMDVLTITRTVLAPGFDTATLEGKVMGWNPGKGSIRFTKYASDIRDATIKYMGPDDQLTTGKRTNIVSYYINVVCFDGRCEVSVTKIVNYGSWDYYVQDTSSYYGFFYSGRRKRLDLATREYMEKRIEDFRDSLDAFLNNPFEKPLNLELQYKSVR